MKEDAEQVLTRKIRRILLISLLFTGGCSVSCLVEIVQDTLQGVWSYVGWAQYLYTMVFCSVIILFFFTILLLYWTHRSFADIFSKGTHLTFDRSRFDHCRFCDTENSGLSSGHDYDLPFWKFCTGRWTISINRHRFHPVIFDSGSRL